MPPKKQKKKTIKIKEKSKPKNKKVHPSNTNKLTVYDDGTRVFTKSYTNKTGSIIHTETTYPAKTQNEILSEDMPGTDRKWTEEAEEVITSDFEEKLKKKIGRYIRYFAELSEENPHRVDDTVYARGGGFIVEVKSDRIRLQNVSWGPAWGVKYKYLHKVFLSEKKMKTPEEKAAEKAEHEKEKKTKKVIREKAKAEKDKAKEKAKEKAKAEKQEAKAEKDKAKSKAKVKKVKLSAEEAESELSKYYSDGNEFGRDKLFKSINIKLNNDKGTESKTYIPRGVVGAWLKKNAK